ncbi:MAG: hypothetical protein AB7O24_22855 [Kofleriaceae bacterium]
MLLINRAALLVIVLVACCTGSPAFAQSAQGDPIAPIRCHQLAAEAGLSDADAIQLCVGASSEAPARCFAQATDQAGASSFEAIRLCRLTRSTAPATCATQLADTTALDTRQRISYCAAYEGPVAAPLGAGSPECLQQALAETALSDHQAAQLCRGSASTAPIECLAWGDDTTALSTRELVELCAPRAIWAPLRR